MKMGIWVKAAASNNASQCVEWCVTEDGVKVADTKQNGAGPVLEFTHAEWEAFLAGVRTDEWKPSRP